MRWRTASASDPQLAGRATFSLERCPDCGSAATIGNAEMPGAMYEGGTYNPSRGLARRLIAPLRGLAERDRLRFVSHLAPGAKVVEVGAGDGKLVAAMRGAGLDARGIDPSPAACAAAAEIGVEVANVGVDEAEFEPASLDAVVIWHALEHFDDPAASLRRIRSWLTPGGALVVAVPNLASLQAQLGGDRWFHQDVPRHRVHLTPAGATALLDRTGFTVGRIRHLLIEQNPLGMWQTLLNRLTGERDFAFRLLKRDLPANSGAGRLRDLARDGDRRGSARPRGAGRRAHRRVGAARRLDRCGGEVSVSAPVASVIVPTVGGGERLRRMLSSVASAEHQTIVVDNGSADGVAAAVDSLPGVEVLRLERNVGYTGAINLGVERADGDIVVLLNDDCVVDPGFVEKITAPIDPGDGVVMAAGVMRDWRDRSLIDSAGMELDQTLLVFDYLNGEPVSRLGGGVADPIGPSGAAAAFDRASFRSIGGFDEGLFAYWEDVDLVLRLRRLGLRCALAPEAIGDHEHSATLGSGSKRKNYLMGYGRGYVLRKWAVLDGRRTGSVLFREAVLCAGQAVVDRNLAGVRGRLRGYREAPASERYPQALGLGAPQGGVVSSLARRARRRSRLRATHRRPAPLRSLAVFHLANTSGPSRSLEAELAWLGETGTIDVVVPGPGTVGSLVPAAEVIQADYEALTAPKPGIRGLALELRDLGRDVRAFRRIIRRRKPELVISVTTMLPAVTIAAWLERVPALVYCGELFDRGYRRGPLRSLANRALAVLTARLSDGIMACSLTVAGQFVQSSARIETVYPPVGDRYASGDGAGLRAELGIPADAPLVASVGNLTEGRGQDVLIRAMPEILRREPAARCVIAGDPFPRPQDVAYRERLLTLITELGLEDSVTVAGHVEDVGDVYAAADVIVNPARFNEPFGRVPFEAAVAGKPSVVTRVGAIPELLRDERSALIVEPEEPYALALAVVRALDDPELAAKLVAGAREIVANRLTPAHSLASFRRAVEAAVGRPVG